MLKSLKSTIPVQPQPPPQPAAVGNKHTAQWRIYTNKAQESWGKVETPAPAQTRIALMHVLGLQNKGGGWALFGATLRESRVSQH